MPAWELGDIRLRVQYRVPPGDATWYEDPNAISLPALGLLNVQSTFSVTNGSGPIATGEIRVQRNVAGAGWGNWIIFKDVVPYISQPPVEEFPVWREDILPFAPYTSTVVQLRADLLWTTPGTSNTITVTVWDGSAEVIGELSTRSVTASLPTRSADTSVPPRAATAGMPARSADATVPARTAGAGVG